MSWASKQWNRAKNAFSDAGRDVGNVVERGAKNIGNAFETVEKNVAQTGKNFVKNPLGTIGAFVTNPLIATAALTTKRTAAALQDYEETDFAKALGAVTVAAGAYTAGAAAAGVGEAVPLSSTGTMEIAGMSAGSSVPLSATGTIGTGAVSTGAAAQTAAAAGGLSALETVALVEGANIGYGEYQAQKADKKAKKEKNAENLKAAAAENAAKDDYKKAVNQNYESYRQAQTQSRYNFTTEAGAFGDYDTKPFSGFDPETGAFTRKKRYV